MATVTMNWNEIHLPIFIFEPPWTLCDEKNHKALIRNPLLSMQSKACHFINWAVYPSESIHVTSTLSQRITRLQMVKCHILLWYTCKYNSIYAYKKSTAFHASDFHKTNKHYVKTSDTKFQTR